MPLFRALVFSSVLVGLIVGVVVTLAQLYATVPLILKAETYEKSSEAEHSGPGPAAPQVQAPGQAQVPAHDHLGHDHVAAAWEPADGLERTLYTAGANILNATGFALLLAGAFSLRRTGVTWREGLLWGLAGFAAFTVAPGLGLPPELPGVPAADLNARQIWWVGTAAATLLGLGLIASSARRSPPPRASACCSCPMSSARPMSPTPPHRCPRRSPGNSSSPLR